ncbi:MAG: TonB C-terminal domain-containing protein [Gemmatimonadota bacterium]|jgi:hypothetical protein
MARTPDPHVDGMLLGSGIGLRHPRPDRRAFLFSAGFHATVVAALMVSGILRGRDLPQFQTVRIRIYSPPPQVEGPPAPEPAVTPQKIVQAPTVEKPVTTPKPKEPVVERPEQTVVQEEVPKNPEPVAGANAKPDSPGGENIDLTQNGDDFPFPEYLENIILQINRFFRWDRDNTPEGVIAFWIARDGSVGGQQMIQKSGDWRFDMQAIAAVTEIGKRAAFGPLPDDWVQDRLWVKFRLIPPGR